MTVASLMSSDSFRARVLEKINFGNIATHTKVNEATVVIVKLLSRAFYYHSSHSLLNEFDVFVARSPQFIVKGGCLFRNSCRYNDAGYEFVKCANVLENARNHLQNSYIFKFPLHFEP